MGGHRSHTKHRPTKEEFYPATWVVTGDFNVMGGFSGVDIDANTEAGYANCYVPRDFDSLEEVDVVFIARATATPMYMRVTTNYAKNGEAYLNSADMGDFGINVVLNNLYEMSINTAVDFTSLEAGDYIGISVSRVAALPTENTDILFLGVRIKYKQQ